MVYKVLIKKYMKYKALLSLLLFGVMQTAIASEIEGNEKAGENENPEPVISIKTNAAAYAAFVPNLGVEIPVLGKFSLDLPFYYSPFDFMDNYKFRIMASQPEVKYWFNKPFRGHSVGIHGIGLLYNVAFNDKDRFQSTNGDRFSYGGGISYGYTLNIRNNWNIEFTAGFGYIHLDHDVFRNVENGALYDNRLLHYFGPTKFGINIIYLFNK